MKQRIQEALRRRHRKEDEGFTLIELLVVILIIAILAAVGIVALLGALRSGKKSAAKTVLTNAVLTTKSVQASNGIDDFTTITHLTLAAEEKDILFVPNVPSAAQVSTNQNTVGLPAPGTATEVVLVSRDGNGTCYYAQLRTSDATQYAADVDCTDAPSAAAAQNSTGWQGSQKAGWRTP